MAASVALAGRLGPVAVAGFGLAFTIWSFLAYLADGLEVAGQVLVGRRLGESNPDAAREAGNRILHMAVVLGLFATVLVAVLRTALPPHLHERSGRHRRGQRLIVVGRRRPAGQRARLLPRRDPRRSRGPAIPGHGHGCGRDGVVPIDVAIVVTDAPLWWIWAGMLVFMSLRLIGLGGSLPG